MHFRVLVGSDEEEQQQQYLSQLKYFEMNDGGSSAAAAAAAAAASNTAGGAGSSSSGIDFILPLIAVSAAALMGTLVVLQTDAVSRRLLSEETNDNKRRNQYKYAWQTGIEKVKIQLDYYLAGGMKNFEEDPDVVWKIMEYVHEDDDLDRIINDRILDKNSLERFSILKIDKDPNDPTDEWYLFLLNDDDNGEKVVYEFPLVKFALKLAKVFEDRVTTTTMVRHILFIDQLSWLGGTVFLERPSKFTTMAYLSSSLTMITLASVWFVLRDIIYCGWVYNLHRFSWLMQVQGRLCR